MNIQLSDNIRETIHRKNLGGLVIGVRRTGSCCGSFDTTDTQLVTGARMDELRKGDYAEYDADGIPVLISRRLTTGGEVSVKMLSLGGLKSFSLSGIQPVCSRI